MDEKEKKRFLMEKESVPHALLKLGIPTMIGMMASALYNLVDSYFVGSLGTSQIAAVSVAFPISVLLLGVGLLFGTGASSYLARLLGAQKHEEAKQCASTAFVTATLTAGCVIVLLLIFQVPLLRVLGATDTILPYAQQYAVPFIVGLLFNVVNITVNNMISAEGAAVYSMVCMLVGGVANIILDPVLIYAAHMGVSGAAYATLISQLISFGLYVYYICSDKCSFRFSFKKIKPSKVLYAQIFKIGVPMLMYELLCSVALCLTNFQAKQFGDAAVAGFGVANRILSLGSMMVIGFLKGYQPFVGFNYGAQKYSRVRSATHYALLWVNIFSVAFGVLLIFAHEPLMHAFTKSDTAMIEVGGKMLIVNAVTFMFIGMVMVYDFLFMGLGRAKEGSILSVSRQGICFIPIILILPAIFGIYGVIVAQPAADVLTLIIFLAMTLHKKFMPEEDGAALAA